MAPGHRRPARAVLSEPPPHWQPGLRSALGGIVGDPVMVGGTWWDCQPVAHLANVGTTVGLWRWQGKIQHSDGGLHWALVQKRLALAPPRTTRWPGEPGRGDWGYWRREAEVLQSPLLADMGSRLRAPTCHAIVDVPGGVDIWMEDLGAPLSRKPGLTNLLEAAHAIGEWQGRYLSGDRAVPVDAFLCHDFLSGYLGHHDDAPAIARAWWALPLARRHLDRSLETMSARLGAGRPRLLAAMATLPRCLNHNDVWPPNMFHDNGGTVLIDWSYAGAGAIGEDAGNMIVDSIFDAIIDPGSADELRDGITREYIDGVASAGWNGDTRLLELGITALAAVKYTWLLAFTLQKIAGKTIEQSAVRLDTDADTLVAARGAGLELCTRMGERALEIAGELAL